jgi:hypothetical protein
MIIKGKAYDILKVLAQIVFPALGAAYFALAGIWGLPSAEQVVGTIVVLDTFLGAVLQISSSRFNASTAKGVINVERKPGGGKLFNLELDGDPEYELEGKSRAIFEVKSTT